MTDPRGHAPQVGYCTNVHSGADWTQAQANLKRHALAVKQRVSPDAPMGIGLWVSARTAAELLACDPQQRFSEWLAEQGLLPFTINGFPQNDFHQPVVKHAVYRPDWRDRRRLDYTCDLARLLHGWLPAGMTGSISTLPVGWGRDWPAADLQEARRHLLQMAEFLEALEDRHGRLIHLDLEPEPGCVLQTAGDVVTFFQEVLLTGEPEARVRRYVRVCHDVCHAAVMFEDQAEVLAAYRGAGIAVGKVQVSAALRARFEGRSPRQCRAVADQLWAFEEPRYLHQTTIRAAGGAVRFYEDLPLARADQQRDHPLTGEWRVHFHVPIYLEQCGAVDTTRRAIIDCLESLAGSSEVLHYEVETYAWGVLPEHLREAELAAGIARELTWLSGIMKGIQD